MKTFTLAAASLLAAAAVSAQTVPYEGDGARTAAWETEAVAAAAAGIVPARDWTAGAGAVTARDWTAVGARLVQPANLRPERDARGIAVISAPAIAPAGWNGIPGAAMGGPELDPLTGAEAAPAGYPACSASVTDRCVQTYERMRHR